MVLPELEALRGVEQSRFHHLDVLGHTLEVLDRTVELTSDGAPAPSTAVTAATRELWESIGGQRERVSAVLAEPLADELTRGEALRWGALLHDAAKPLTRAVRPADGRVTFIGHDVRGAQLARDVLARLHASERLRAHVAALVRQPPAPRVPRPRAPAAVPAQRVRLPARMHARRGRRDAAVDRRSSGHPRRSRARRPIEAHLALAGRMLADALDWRAHGPPTPLLRGDELARELGIPTGPAGRGAARRAGRRAVRRRARTRASEALAYARGLREA